MTKKALFPGSFDPFTHGHASLVERGLEIVDEIVIAIGVNDEKRTCFSVEQRLESIRSLYKDDARITVCTYKGLTVDFAKAKGLHCILRGIRTTIDFEYEKPIADLNRHLAGIETLFLFSLPQHAHISSTAVRQLLPHRSDLSAFVPLPIIENLLPKQAP